MPEICTVYVQNCTNRTLVLSGYGDKSSPTQGSTYQMDAWAFGSILPLYVEPFGVGFSDQSQMRTTAPPPSIRSQVRSSSASTATPQNNPDITSRSKQ
jgi:hypothetical protein